MSVPPVRAVQDVRSSLLTLLHASASADEVDVARTLLFRERETVLSLLPEPIVIAAIASAPTERLDRFEHLLPWDGVRARAFPVLEAALNDELWNACRRGATLAAAARMTSIVCVLHRLGAMPRTTQTAMRCAILVQDGPPRRLYVPLYDWCASHRRLTDEMVRLVVTLREEEILDYPILHKLVAWVAPSPARMLALARWEAAQRGESWGDAAFLRARARWAAGFVDDAADAALLAAIAREGNVEYVREAHARHGDMVRVMLEEAAQRAARGGADGSPPEPLSAVILGTWARALERRHEPAARVGAR